MDNHTTSPRKTSVCLNAVALSEYATLNLGRGMSAVECCIEEVRRLHTDTYIIANSALSDRVQFPSVWSVELKERWRITELFDYLLRHINNNEHVVYLALDTPFFDIELTQRMQTTHRDYAAEFTFSDGYPEGIAPEIINCSIIRALKRLIKDDEILKQSTHLFDILQRDINSFDIETELAPLDLRPLRLSLHCNNRHNYLICKELISRNVKGSDAIIRVLVEHPQIVRQLPAFVSIEVVARSSQQVSYLPYSKVCSSRSDTPHEFELDVFEKLIADIARLSPHATIHISLWGEVALHTNVIALIDIVRAHALKLLIESSGVGWKTNDLVRIQRAHYSDVVWIVALDSNDPALYQELRGDGYEEAQKFAHTMLERFHENTYVQITRMQKTESHLEKFYRYWKEKTDKIIVMKYDYFSGALPQLKVTDISPVQRAPCWHIKRDISIMVDGRVPVCKEDILMQHVLGNIHTDSLEDIWSRGAELYERHLKKDYPAICDTCDEYYTYNA